MPDWGNYYFSYDAEPSASSDFYVTIPRFTQEMREEEQEKQAKERQEQEDRKKYPLFYWKENI